ncbi:MAG: SurA N-terminal domain-containing protein, partial [Bacteroidales bacterium]|nr:SurA N-terminal domain-containing protein [Bacteroidales bacterium]
MATLQTLRNKAGVFLAGIIGLSLLAFILGDFINSGSGMFNARKNRVGEINGKSVSYQDFASRMETATENYKRSSGSNSLDEQTIASIREQVWGSFMNDLVYTEEYKKLGLECSADELFDMVYGKNIHPQLQQAPAFQNKVTGAFDRNMVMQYLKSMEQNPEMKQQWIGYEKELQKDRISTKYQTLIAKGMYVTRKMADADYNETNRKFNLSFVPIRYAVTPDSLIKVTDADVQKYYEANKDKFKQEATRDLAYVVWDIVPSQADKDEVA